MLRAGAAARRELRERTCSPHGLLGVLMKAGALLRQLNPREFDPRETQHDVIGRHPGDALTRGAAPETRFLCLRAAPVAHTTLGLDAIVAAVCRHVDSRTRWCKP